MPRLFKPLLVTLPLLLPAQGARALESAPVKTPHAEVTLVSETDAVAPNQRFRLGLRFRLAKGWHIYWLNPGDAGEPPHLDLTLPEGASASEFAFPTPLRIPEGPVMTYSYLGEVLLPLAVTPSAAASGFPIKAKASWLICEKICVPEEGSFALDLPVGAAAPSPQARLFAETDRRIPRPSPFTASLSSDAVLTLAGEAIAPGFAEDAWFFPDKWGVIDDAAPQKLAIGERKLTLAFRPAQTFDAEAGLSGIFVAKDKDGAESFYQIAARPDAAAASAAPNAPAPAARPAKPATPSAAPAAVDIGIVTMLALAFLGGLILNLMPCVFPVLSLKAMALAHAGAQQTADRRRDALA